MSLSLSRYVRRLASLHVGVEVVPLDVVVVVAVVLVVDGEGVWVRSSSASGWPGAWDGPRTSLPSARARDDDDAAGGVAAVVEGESETSSVLLRDECIDVAGPESDAVSEGRSTCTGDSESLSAAATGAGRVGGGVDLKSRLSTSLTSVGLVACEGTAVYGVCCAPRPGPSTSIRLSTIRMVSGLDSAEPGPT